MYICLYSYITWVHLKYRIFYYIRGCSNYSLNSSMQKVGVHTRFLKWKDETLCLEVIILINAGGVQQPLKTEKNEKE